MAAALSLGCGVAAADPGYVANVIPCEQRTLVLSAFPAEADAVLAHTALDANPVVVADRRRYYLGSISGKKVIVAMTGIGLVNATNTTETAFARFTCASSIAIAAVMFSGVAGGAGRTSIGDVAIPARWTLDNIPWGRSRHAGYCPDAFCCTGQHQHARQSCLSVQERSGRPVEPPGAPAATVRRR
ncbi:hypothetical protein [Mycobacterium tuberculosis]|uniref:5'-methylthioadenosine/S-adenosylhomocysteine nucleosidase family protein n=1 Tax=Mycobacterium tuberculosis TaxID=1773 RepID=UPI001F36A3FB|nr:hypothetical protein [Mycobacterium tuberculosis]